jgi:hypothetical protein
LAEYFSHPLTETQLLMYAEDLSDLTPDQAVEAALRYRKNPKTLAFRFHPN